MADIQRSQSMSLVSSDWSCVITLEQVVELSPDSAPPTCSGWSLGRGESQRRICFVLDSYLK